MSFQSIAMVLKVLWIQTLLCKYLVIVFYLCREPSTFNACSAAAAQPRTRRFSASCSLYSSGLPSPRLTPRVSQLRQEECIDVMYREAAHERELNSTMVMSQSWEDLRLVGDTPNKVIHWLNYFLYLYLLDIYIFVELEKICIAPKSDIPFLRCLSLCFVDIFYTVYLQMHDNFVLKLLSSLRNRKILSVNYHSNHFFK